MSEKYGPLWQLKQNLSSKILANSADEEDLKRITQRIEARLAEIKEYEFAINLLENPREEV